MRVINFEHIILPKINWVQIILKCDDEKNLKMIDIETEVNTVLDPAPNTSVQRIWNDDFEYEEQLMTYTLSEVWVYMALTTW